jgi:hypothetical protein
LLKAIFGRSAEAEIELAVDHYNAMAPELGVDFLLQVEAAVQHACFSPTRFMVIARRGDREVRRVLLKRFPYYVAFTIVGTQLRVISVAHSKRQPGYWRSRIPL